MNDSAVAAFFDELEKLAVAMPDIPVGGKLRLLKYPLMFGGAVAGWEHLKKMKRRYDVGKAYEQQMSARG